MYDLLFPKWERARLVYGGEDSVHDAGELLLPKLQMQDPIMYANYKKRARFLPAFKRTVQGLSGTVMRKDPTFDIGLLDDYAENIDGSGTTLIKYSKMVLKEELTVGVCGTLVEYQEVGEDITVAQKEAKNLRSYLAFYRAENIINWKWDVIDNVKKLTLVVLEEKVNREVNEFESKQISQYRVLRLKYDAPEGFGEEDFEMPDDFEPEYYYTQQLYTDEDSGMIEHNEKEILINGKRMDMIPFFFHGEYDSPPLEDLINTNIKHYQLKADHNHALHYIGLPTPIFPGIDPKDPDKPTSIGPEQIVYISDPQAKPFYLTYGGEGLGSVEKELLELKQDMAYLGAAMLAPDTMVAETATKAVIRRAGETASLTVISEDVSESLTNALRFMAIWEGETNSDEIYILLTKDFNPLRLDAQELTALVSAWQNGAISKEVLFWNLQQGEIVPGETNYADEEERIQNQLPASGGLISDDEEEEETDDDTDDDNTDDDGSEE